MSVLLGALAFLWLCAGLIVVVTAGYVAGVVRFDESRLRDAMQRPRSIPATLGVMAGAGAVLVVLTTCVHWVCVVLGLLREV